MIRSAIFAVSSFVGAVLIGGLVGPLPSLILTALLAGDLYPRPGVFFVFMCSCVAFAVAGALVGWMTGRAFWTSTRADLVVSLVIGVCCGVAVCSMCWHSWDALEVP